jgi:LysM repeat protein
VNQDSTFPDYLFKPINQDNELVEQEPENQVPEVQTTIKPEASRVEKKEMPAKIEVEKKVEVQQVSNANEAITITVESGQTLAGLARKYQVNVQDIKNLNGLTTDVLQLGQLLRIPKVGTSPVPTPQASMNGLHEVQSGETLNKISRKYGIDVDKIKQANNLDNDVINVGQKLKIPQ